MNLSAKHFVLSVVLLTSVASAQVVTGTPPFGSFGGGPFDTVNLGNLNVHFAIPVLHKAGRGIPFTYDLSYDSSIWTPGSSNGVVQWQPALYWGWRGQTEAKVGYVSYTAGSLTCYYTVGLVRYVGSIHTWGTNYVYHDAWGVAHPFAGTSNLWSGSGAGGCTLGSNNSVTATTTDGTGYALSVNIAVGTVTSRTGAVIKPPFGGGGGSGTFTDTNGNEITVNSSGQFFDTLSSTLPVLTVSSAAPPTTTTFTYPGPTDGASNCSPITSCVSYSMNYQQYTVATNFGVSGVSEYGPGTSGVPLVSSIVLPDGSSYAFAYEKTPGSCTTLPGTYSANCVTGRIASVTLPTGGTITYKYTGIQNGIFSDGSTAGFQRSLSPNTCSSGGCWQYSRALQSGTPGTGSTWTTTVIDPNNNYTMINSAEDAATTLPTHNFYETQRQVYSGSSTLLATTIHCYNGNYVNCNNTTTTVSSPITQTDAYTELPTTPTPKIRLSEVTYNTYGLVTGDKEYDYGVSLGSAPSSTYLLSNTTIGYYAVNNGIASMRQTVVTKDGGGHTKASASYTFDGATVTGTTNTPQHVSEGTVRGNLTNILAYSSASLDLSQSFTYYDTGNVNTSTDVNGAIATYKYGACGNSFLTETDLPPATTGATPMKTYLTWDTNCTGGVVTQSTDANNNATSYSYGDANYWRLTGTSFPDGGSTSTTYNFGTNSQWSIQTSSAQTSSANVTGEALLDGFGRVVQTEATSDPTGNIDYVKTVYDSIGRVASVTNPYQTTSDPTYGITQYGYDALNRITSVIHPDNTQATFGYTGAGTQVTDEGSNSGGSAQIQRVYQSDGLGRLVSVCEVSSASQLGSSGTPAACGQDIAATGFLTSYGYDALGNLLSVTQGSLTRSYTYDYLSRLTQEVNPESGTTTYSYDTGTAGDIYQRTRPKPNQTGTATVVATYAFDKLHRPTGTSYNDGSTPSVTLSYDQSSVSGITLVNYLGNLTNAVAANGSASTIFSYDKMGRVAEDWQCTPLNCGTGNFSLTFGYDLLGDVTSLANSKEGATYTYTYDTLARLTKLQSSLSDSNHPGTLVTVNTYNPLGEVTKATLGNGIVRTMGFDDRGRMTSLTDGSIYSFSLGFAGDSNVVTGNDSVNGNWTYTYDGFNRISASNKNSGAQTFSYAYDRYSNRWQQNAPQGGPAPQYSFNANNQITASGVVYDAAGNVTQDGLGNTYTYDAENRVISMTGNNAASYVYDALGQRVRSTINSTPYDFIYNGGAAVDEVTASSWVWGDAGASQLAVYNNSTTYFNHTDWLGTVRAWSNVSGTSVGTCTSLPFGDAQTCTGTSANSWDYTGLPFDSESGMTHALFRQLSTTQGRWTASDPAGLAAVDPTNPQSWNRYAYVNNTPTNAADPLGLFCPVIPWETPFSVQQSLQGQIHCSEPGDDVWFYGTGPSGYDGVGFCGTCAPPSLGFGSGFSADFSGGACDSDFMPCGLPTPGLYQSIWQEVGLPTDLNCPQSGGIFGPLCGGVSPFMDADPQKQAAHDCYNGIMNGTAAGKAIGVLSVGPVLTPLNDESPVQQLMTIGMLWTGPGLKAIAKNLFPVVAEKAIKGFELGTGVASALDLAVAQGCAMSSVFVPNGPETPPGVDPYNPNDPWNW